ncbi:MAG: hypothetical protein ACXAC8_14670 [Candidatus Hodarchaeales archaeon]
MIYQSSKSSDIDFFSSVDSKNSHDFRERYLSREKQRSERISKWFIQYESLIVENNIDLTSFFKFMEIIDTINPENIQILKDLQETLNFESLP